MRIAYISLENPYNPLNNGGIGTYTGVIAEGMSKLQNEVHLLTVGKEEADYMESGIHVHVISEPHTKRMFYLEQAYKMNDKLQRIIEEQEIDLVETPEWLAQGIFVVSEARVPVITRLHTPLYIIESICNGQRIYRDSEEIKRYERLQAKRSRAVTAPCDSICDWIMKEWDVGSKVISNPINVWNYQASECEEPTILYMGRLEYRKGILVFAQCIEQLVKNIRDIRIIICGQDTFYKKKSMRRIIEDKCRNDKHIEFISHATKEEKKILFQRSKVVVLPSLWENFSYVCLEAMAQGKTVVATKSGGFVEMIKNNENGYLVPPGDSDALYRILSDILLDRLPTTGKKARNDVEKQFSIDVLGEKYMDMYKSIVL